MAALQSEPTAQFSLGGMYLRGEGVPSDSVEGYKWMILAERNGVKEARQLRQKLEDLLTANQKSDGQRRAELFGLP